MNSEESRDSAIDWVVRQGHADAVLAALARRQARRRRRRAMIGGGALLCMLLLAAVVLPLWRAGESNGGRSGPALVMRSPERLMLEDGSVVQLRTGAAVETTFTSHQRSLRLLRGQIHVKVAKDQRRPFIVSAGMFNVRAVGTAFSVSETPDGVDVLVTEGVVAVGREESMPVPEKGDDRDQALALLKAGDHASLESRAGLPDAPRATVRNLPPEEMSERLAWRIPMIEISETPLVEILPVLTEHAGVEFVLADPEIGQHRLSGIIRADNIEALFQLLDQSFDVQATAVGARTFELRRR